MYFPAGCMTLATNERDPSLSWAKKKTRVGKTGRIPVIGYGAAPA
jgi:hypothetical protein